MKLTQAQKDIITCKSRFRVINCGRRFGKTTLSVYELIGKASGKSGSMVAYIAPCYDEETEILTDKGWKYFKDLDKTEKVATYKKGTLVFEKPKEYFVYDYDGEMVGIDNQGVDMLVTPHHRCLVKNHRKGDWMIKKAEEIEKTWVYRFKKDAGWNGKGKCLKQWARFWGWYVSEGYSRHRYINGYETIITQKKEEFFDDIRKTLTDCGLVFKEDKRTEGGINFRISKFKELTEKCLLLGKSHQKYVFDEIKNASKEIIEEFLEAYWNGDGHYPKNSYDYKRAETNSKRLADDLQELIIKVGGSATVRKINGRNLYSVSWLNKKFNQPLIRKEDYYRIKYTGKVYCVRVSSGIVMVRRNGKHYWSGNTYQQARDIAWEMLKKIVAPVVLNINESRLEIKIRAADGKPSTIVLRGWEAVETLRGQKFDLLVIDEIASMKNFALLWEEVLRPTLTDNKGEAIFISTPKGFNHFYDLYNRQNDPVRGADYKSFHYTSYDNPFLPRSEIDQAKKEMGEDKFAQEYLADFRKTQGLVYKDFDRSIHVYQTTRPKEDNYRIINNAETLVGIDWGWTNPAAIGKIYRDTDSNYYLAGEWYHTHKTTSEIIEMAKSFGGNKYYPDPAEPDRIDEARKAKLNVREVSKDIEAGISAVQELLKTRRFFIHESCINTLYEIETYSYPDKKPEQNEKEVPIKENDHMMDTIRYVLYMQVGKNVQTKATTRYSASSMPIINTASGPKLPREAQIRYQQL